MKHSLKNLSQKINGFQDTIAWYDANAKKYAKNIENVSNPELLDRFADAVGEGVKVLDAGCAAGRDCKLLKERNLTPIGIDLSAPLLEIAKEKNPSIEFYQGDFTDLPFENKTFNGVWAHASLLHLETIEEVRRALKEFYRVLKKGGRSMFL